MTKFLVLDSEGDNLAYTCTKLHNLCWTEDGKEFGYTTNYDEMREVLSQEDVLFVAHNDIMHDMVAFGRILGLNLQYSQFVDTLALTWVFYPEMPKSGLEAWGEIFGFPKVKIANEEWAEGNEERMRERVERDVLINWHVWKRMEGHLTELYGGMNDEALRYLRFVSYKMDMLREQEEVGIKVDLEAANSHLEELQKLKMQKVEVLQEVMPKKPIMESKSPPKVMFKKDGSLSANGVKWHEFLKGQGLPSTTNTEVKYITGWNYSIPTYSEDVKEWLFSLGWQPATFKFVRNKETNEVKQIPQIKYPKGHDREGELCDSVTELAEQVPEIEHLVGLSVIQHRIGLFNGKGGFLNNHREGRVVAGAHGFTNTMRLKHKAPIANLPGVDAAYGKWVRGVLVVSNGNKRFVGADVTSLEDTLKQHFIYPFDKEYVQEMQKEGYEPHLSLALFAGAITQEQYDTYPITHDKEVKAIRKRYKAVNYASQYGVREKTLSRSAQCTVPEAKVLLDMYWKKNWAINKVASMQYVKTDKEGKMWLKNPLNGFYYHLKVDKDIFSTLVQGSGDYLFTLWTMFCRKAGIKLSLNIHDEWLTEVDEDKVEETIQKAKDAMKKVNETLKLNVEAKMDAQVGMSYAECH